MAAALARPRASEPGEESNEDGISLPRRTILGSEFAGGVEAVGEHVTSFAEGDAVLEP
jgi:NADPH:quinone reductase-like Zn-dependent oxidoreductase